MHGRGERGEGEVFVRPGGNSDALNGSLATKGRVQPQSLKFDHLLRVRTFSLSMFLLVFTKYFTKLSPALNIILVDGKISIDVFTLDSKELILSSVAPLFNNIQGLTIEIVQHFEDSDEIGTEVGE